MTPALAVPMLAALVRLASIDADLGVRAEARSTTVVVSDLPDLTRGSLYTTPRATVRAHARGLRLATTYAPRLWTSDLAVQTSPFVSHTADARLQTTEEGAWRADVTASATRGTTDPLADPWQTQGLQREQVATTSAYDFEELALGALSTWIAGRTTIAATGGFHLTRPTDAGMQQLLPPQRTASGEASVTRLATENDTLRLEARTALSITDAPAGEARSDWSSAIATWQRRTTPHLSFRVAGGATFASFDSAADVPVSTVLPMAEVAVMRGGGVRVNGDAAARLTTTVDRFDGEVSSIAEAVCSVEWRPAPRLSLSASVTGGARTDGDTVLGRTHLRAQWMIRERLVFEAGAAGSLQRERRPDVPSFVEGNLLANLAWTVRERLALELGLTGRSHHEHRENGRSFFEGAAFVGVVYGSGGLFGTARAAPRPSPVDPPVDPPGAGAPPGEGAPAGGGAGAPPG